MTPPKFPTMLRKMWSGQEVQDWIETNWRQGETPPKVSASAAATVGPACAQGYEFPRSDPEKAPAWVIDPDFVFALRDVIQSRDDLIDFSPDPQQIESVLLALEAIHKKPL